MKFLQQIYRKSTLMRVYVHDSDDSRDLAYHLDRHAAREKLCLAVSRCVSADIYGLREMTAVKYRHLSRGRASVRCQERPAFALALVESITSTYLPL